MTVSAAKHLITASEFTQMCEAGVFREDDRLELIEGEIIEMSPIGKRHAAVVRRLTNLLARTLGEDEALVDARNPVVLGHVSEPQPDLALLRPRPDFYAEHPRPEDVLLLIEVADTSLAYDRYPPLKRFLESACPSSIKSSNAGAGRSSSWLSPRGEREVPLWREERGRYPCGAEPQFGDGRTSRSTADQERSRHARPER